jgi:hypothetical protein
LPSIAGLFTNLAFAWDGVNYNATMANTGTLGFGTDGSLIFALFGTNCGPSGFGCGVGNDRNLYPHQWFFGISLGVGAFEYITPSDPLGGPFNGSVMLTGPVSPNPFTSVVVYRPLAPCRILDTRVATAASGVHGPLLGGVLFQIPGFVPTGQNWGQFGGTPTTDCGLTNPPGTAIRGVTVVATILAPTFDAYLGISDANNLSTVLSSVALNYVHGQGLSTMYIVPQIASNNIYFAMPTGLSANLILDVVGYYAVADATSLQCTAQTSAPVTIGGSNGTGSATSPLCGAGYALTAGSCDSSAPGMSLTQDKATLGNTAWLCSAQNRGATAANLTATAICCRVPGK